MPEEEPSAENKWRFGPETTKKLIERTPKPPPELSEFQSSPGSLVSAFAGEPGMQLQKLMSSKRLRKSLGINESDFKYLTESASQGDELSAQKLAMLVAPHVDPRLATEEFMRLLSPEMRAAESKSKKAKQEQIEKEERGLRLAEEKAKIKLESDKQLFDYKNGEDMPGELVKDIDNVVKALDRQIKRHTDFDAAIQQVGPILEKLNPELRDILEDRVQEIVKGNQKRLAQEEEEQRSKQRKNYADALGEASKYKNVQDPERRAQIFSSIAERYGIPTESFVGEAEARVSPEPEDPYQKARNRAAQLILESESRDLTPQETRFLDMYNKLSPMQQFQRDVIGGIAPSSAPAPDPELEEALAILQSERPDMTIDDPAKLRDPAVRDRIIQEARELKKLKEALR